MGGNMKEFQSNQTDQQKSGVEQTPNDRDESTAKASMIGLPEAIQSLRAELSEAMKQGTGQELRFKVGPVELEFAVEVGREVGGSGGVKFWVVSLEAKGTVTTATTHRVKLTLTPITSEGKDLNVEGQVPWRPQ